MGIYTVDILEDELLKNDVSIADLLRGVMVAYDLNNNSVGRMLNLSGTTVKRVITDNKLKKLTYVQVLERLDLVLKLTRDTSIVEKILAAKEVNRVLTEHYI